MSLRPVTESQIVAGMLRSIGQQLVKLAERLDAEAMSGLPIRRKKAPVETVREALKRFGAR